MSCSPHSDAEDIVNNTKITCVITIQVTGMYVLVVVMYRYFPRQLCAPDFFLLRDPAESKIFKKVSTKNSKSP